MTTQTDPAKRLFDILDTVISFGKGAGYGPEAPAIRGWSQALSIEENEVLNILFEIFQVINLCEQRIQQKKDINQALYLMPLVNVKTALLSIGFSGTRSKLRRHLDDGMLLSMQIMSDVLSNWIDVEKIDTKDLKLCEKRLKHS